MRIRYMIKLNRNIKGTYLKKKLEKLCNYKFLSQYLKTKRKFLVLLDLQVFKRLVINQITINQIH